MNRRLAQLAVLTALAGPLLLVGCGYRPLYGSSADDAGVAASLSGIAIPEATTRAGQIIRNDLLSGLRPTGEDRYTLDLVSDVKTSGVIVKAQPAVTRQSVTVSATYRLVDRQSGEAVTSGKTFAQASFDAVRQPVADMQAEADATERAAHEVSADIRTRLAAYFASRS